MATHAVPSHNGPPPKSSVPPNQTLYITSLPSRASTLTKHDLRLSLYTLFSTYGPVLDVVAMKTAKMRGQAHVVFRDVRDATQAMRAENGREFFGKELKVEYARGKSDTIKKLDGTYRMPTSKEGAQEVTSTSLQQAIFGAPPGSLPSIPPAAASLPPIPPAPVAAAKVEKKVAEAGSGATSRGTSEGLQGVKRAREESDEEEAPMEEESDDDVEMEQESDESE